MEPIESVEMVNVLMISDSGKKANLFRLAADTTISELKRLWEAEHELPEGSVVRKTDGSRLDDGEQISEIEEVSPGSKTVNVLIEKAIKLRVGVYKCSAEDMRSISVELGATPGDLHPQVGRLFELGGDRHFRLMSQVMPLLYDRTFEHQHLESGSSVFIDLAYEFDVTDEWTSAVTKHFAYASEKAADVLTDDDRPQKMLLDGVEVNLHGDIHSILPADYRKMTNVILHHQQQRSVSLLVKKSMRQRQVWPTDASGRLVENCPPMKPRDLFFEEERLQTDTSMKQLRLPRHAFVHAKSTVTVKLSNGRRKVVKVADMATVGDLQAAVCSLEGTSLFMLTSGGRRLKRHETMAAVRHGCVEVERTGDTVVVHLSDRSVRFPTEQRKLRFTDLMRKVAEKGGGKWEQLVRTPLQCEGCGRRVCRQEEPFQTVPANCCRVRSLILADATPTKTKDAGRQGSWRVTPKRVGAGRRRVGRGVQIRRKRQAAATETRRDSPFFVWNRCEDFNNGNNFSVVLRLPGRPTVGDVRRAIAHHMRRPPARTELRRWVGRTKSGEEVFDVGRNPPPVFADVSGGEKNWREVMNEFKTLHDDDQPFPVVAGHENRICVRPR